jgi:hypothetical protein
MESEILIQSVSRKKIQNIRKMKQKTTTTTNNNNNNITNI